MERIKLGEICEIVSGSTPKTGVDRYWNGDIDWITPAELKDETYIIEESQRKITQIAVQETGLKPFPKGTVILSSRAPIGKVAIAGKEMYCNQGFRNLICSDRVDSRYLYWYLKGHTDYLNSLGRGATFKEISKTIVENIEIPLPDMNKQINYANTLKKCWDILLALKEQVGVFDELIKSRFVEMFGSCENMVSIAELCSIITDGTHQPPKFQGSGIPFIFVSNLAENKVTYNTEKFISEDTYNELIKRTPIERGDVLLSTVGSYGHPAVVVEDKKFLFQRHIAYMKPKHDVINSFYLYSALLAPDVQRQIEEKVKGIAQKTLNLSEIRKIMLPVPPIELQEQFSTFFHQIDKLKLTAQKRIEKMETLKNKLMQQFFN